MRKSVASVCGLFIFCMRFSFGGFLEVSKQHGWIDLRKLLGVSLLIEYYWNAKSEIETMVPLAKFHRMSPRIQISLRWNIFSSLCMNWPTLMHMLFPFFFSFSSSVTTNNVLRIVHRSLNYFQTELIRSNPILAYMI